VDTSEEVIEKELDDLLKTNPLGELHLDAMYDDLVKEEDEKPIVEETDD
jgi:hypothetical protein